MKNIIILGLLSTAAALATPIDSVTLVSADNGPLVGNVIFSPYTLSINGVNTTALCIDFADHVTLNEQWSAYVSTDGGDISNTYHSGSAQQYKEEAYLFQQITKAGISSQTRIDLQEAAWDIMNPGYWGTNNVYKPDATALNYVTDAQQNYASDNYSNYQIVSGVDASGSRPQEFLIAAQASAAPEPAGFALLGGVLLLAGSLFRRKPVKAKE